MKYNGVCRLYSFVFLKMLKSYYKKYDKERYKSFKELSKRTKKEFREMIERTPGLDGESLESQLIGAAFFFSMAKADSNLTPELLDDIIIKSINSAFMQKAHKREKESGALFSDKTQDKKTAEAIRSQSSDKLMGWKFTYEKGTNEFRCTYTKCGICTLAKREHVEEFLPSMCKMDFETYKMVGAELIRTKTLANGDECCNFYVKRMTI